MGLMKGWRQPEYGNDGYIHLSHDDSQLANDYCEGHFPVLGAYVEFYHWLGKNNLMTAEELRHRWWHEAVWVVHQRDPSLAAKFKTLMRLGVIEL